ncbi:hypothetical protein EHS25_006479 [Saitozyma podzolica]|uniref:Peptidase S54 rhomboid domain-containing protein n=1 Tax=Saitozyma podzolica TaxID=1890683 RepID=A0A427YRW9_9TREE|nr:hypothetical protein EHS25_006479 [Saitozyma podzolica]
MASSSAFRSIHTGPTASTSRPQASAKVAQVVSSHFPRFLSSSPRIPHPLHRSFPGVGLRSFWTSRTMSVRQTYFPKGSGYGYGGDPRGGGGSWWSNFRRRIDRLPEIYVIYGLIGINVAVFLLWQYAVQSWQRFRDPALYQWLTKNFILNENNIMAGRIWTLLTACFSHSSGSHIFVNCLGLYFIAPAAAALVGSSAFLGLYLAGGVLASLMSLSWHRLRGDRWRGSEGASGAIYASLAFYAALFPNTTFLLFFVVPMPAWAMVGGIFAYDAYSAIFRPESGTDSAGHVGGILAGLGAAMMVRRRGPRAFRRW